MIFMNKSVIFMSKSDFHEQNLGNNRSEILVIISRSEKENR